MRNWTYEDLDGWRRLTQTDSLWAYLVDDENVRRHQSSLQIAVQKELGNSYQSLHLHASLTM